MAGLSTELAPVIAASTQWLARAYPPADSGSAAHTRVEMQARDAVTVAAWLRYPTELDAQLVAIAGPGGSAVLDWRAGNELGYPSPGGSSPGGSSPGGSSPGGSSPGGSSPGGSSPGGSSPGGSSPGGSSPGGSSLGGSSAGGLSAGGLSPGGSSPGGGEDYDEDDEGWRTWVDEVVVSWAACLLADPMLAVRAVQAVAAVAPPDNRPRPHRAHPSGAFARLVAPDPADRAATVLLRHPDLLEPIATLHRDTLLYLLPEPPELPKPPELPS